MVKIIKEIVIASHNEGKVKEIRSLLKPLGFKIYSAKNKYYRGVNLKFYEKKFNIIKKNIYLKELNQFDEILLVGSGKGVVSTSYIVDSNWKRRKSKIFNSIYKTFEKEFKKEKYIFN